MTRTCERDGCGRPLRGRRSDTRYCSAACKQAARRARRDAGGVPAGDTAGPNGDGIGDVAGRVRAVLSLLDGRRSLTAGEARWCEQARRVLADGAVLERLERAEVRLAEREGVLLSRAFVHALTVAGLGPNTATRAEWLLRCSAIAEALRLAGTDPGALPKVPAGGWAEAVPPASLAVLPPGRGTVCEAGPPGTPGSGFCARWPGCRTDAAGTYVGGLGEFAGCDYPSCKPPPCREPGRHKHTRLDGTVYEGKVLP